MTQRDVGLAVLITAIWGFNFSVIKLGLHSLDPFLLAGLRFFLCAFPCIFFVKRPSVAMKYLVSYGLLFGVGLWGLISLAIASGISAGVASLVLQMSAFFTLILAALLLKERISFAQKLGFLVALFGLGLIISVADGSVSSLGLTLTLCAALSLSFTNIIIKKAKLLNVFSFMVYASLFSPLPLFFLAYLNQGAAVFFNFFEALDATALFSIAFQVYPTTLLGYWVWNTLLNKYPVSSVAPLSLLIPVFGLAGSWVMFSESIGLLKVFACVFIILGLVLNTFGERLFKSLSQQKC